MSWEEYKYYFVRCYEQQKFSQTGCCGPVLVVLAVVFILASCKTVEYVPVEIIRTEYKTKTDTFIQKDSVNVKDSVLIKIKGDKDTVRIEHWHTKYIERQKEKASNDTCQRTDTVTVPVPVERKLSKWETFCIDYGKVMVGTTATVLLILIFLVARWVAGHRRKA